ncbi:hypothetical protein SADUNF_Sadunf14G0066500 [Salix dunnii]|uniref:Uncharacterized protein n=1 Tax=Salix dunnii TaxID=1413687 RepID=A0A835JL19_9ROSI|nr:hypothetical protein SADUNF_Sadunf14G0066500 [Salix dunnii]
MHSGSTTRPVFKTMTKRQEPSRHVITCIAARLSSCHRYGKASTRDNTPIPLSSSLAFHIKSDSVLVIQCSKFDFLSLINDLIKKLMFLDPDADLSIPQILKSQREINLINITSVISLSSW